MIWCQKLCCKTVNSHVTGKHFQMDILYRLLMVVRKTRQLTAKMAGSHDKSDLFNDGCLPMLNVVLSFSCAYTMPLHMYEDPARDAVT